MTIDFGQVVIGSFVGGAVPAIIFMMDNRRRAKNQAKKEQEAIKEELNKKHSENTKRLDQQDEKLDEILSERKYIPSHGHREKRGPLTAEGIHYPPREK